MIRPEGEASMAFNTVKTAARGIGGILAALGVAGLAMTAAAQDPAAQRQPDPQKQYLAANATKPGVMTTPSGLQFRILKDAAVGAKSPESTDIVLVHWEGRLVDGTVFDICYQRGELISFSPLDRVIAGWTEGVGLMRVGETRELVIPSELAYGARGVPGTIPPNATLVFKVELLDITDPADIPPR